MIKVSSSDKLKKSTREGINEGKMKSLFFLFLSYLIDNYLLKVITATI